MLGHLRLRLDMLEMGWSGAGSLVHVRTGYNLLGHDRPGWVSLSHVMPR
jgi:hypothetical protein